MHDAPRPIRLLVLEDSPADAELSLRALKRGGFDVGARVVSDRRQFVESLDSFRPDAVLADYQLPDFDGMAALELVRERAPHVPVIIITGSTNEETAVACMRAGAADYVLKDRLQRLGLALRGAMDRQRDRDEQARVARALLESEQRLQLAADGAGLAMWEWQRDGDRVLLNRQASGLIRDAAVHGDVRKQWEAAIHPDDRARRRAAITQHMVERTERFEVEYRVQVPSGEWRWMLERGRCLERDADDVPVRVAGAGLDVTERKLEHEEHRRLAEAIEQATEAVLIANASGAIEYASPAWERLTGLAAAQTVGRPLEEVFRELTNDAAARALQDAATRGVTWQQRVPGPVRDGLTTEREFLVAPLRADGDLTGVVLIGRDVTQQAALEGQLRHAQKMEAIGRLAGGVAHDFNNLLTAISGYSELALLTLPPGDATRHAVEEILKAAERAGTLTRQLLTFSRKQTLQPSVLSINDVVFDIERMLRRMIGEDVDLVLSLDPALGRVYADPAQVELVLINLAVNARDAMPTGGRLVISTTNVADASHGGAGPAVRLQVADTGEGMSDAVRSRIFEPFFTTKEAGRGTGLGLSTVYGIVEQSGGRISVASAPGGGSTFTVDFPRVASERPQPTGHPAAGPMRGGHESVLVVEDDVALRRMLVQVLTSQGYEVIEAGNGDLALARARSHGRPIPVAVVDVVLPRQSGLDIAEQLLELLPGLRVLFISGYAPGESVRRRLTMPGVALLAKPFKPVELTARVRALLDAPRS